VISADLIKTLSVPRATGRWFGIDSVTRAPGFVMMMWLPACRAMRSSSRSNARTTSLALATGSFGTD